VLRRHDQDAQVRQFTSVTIVQDMVALVSPANKTNGRATAEKGPDDRAIAGANDIMWQTSRVTPPWGEMAEGG
jgi:hypothetical protein